jgi:sirohydrochlorin cobaltochelatase
VVQRDFSQDALVLLGHGTTLNPDSSAPVFLHAAELRRRKIFAEVREAFWKQTPALADVLSGVTAPRLFLAPLFISEGFFSEQAIPRALGLRADSEIRRVQQRGAQTLFYCKPVGTHESMTAVLLHRAREVVERFPFPRAPATKDVTLFIAGHGTEQDENSRKPIERQVELIREAGIYAAVHAVFMEEDPRIGECSRIAQTRNIVVVPFFISDGLHVREDIPVLLGAAERIVRQRLESGQPTWRNPTEVNGKLVWYAPSVGSDPRIADVILERVREASQWTERHPTAVRS